MSYIDIDVAGGGGGSGTVNAGTANQIAYYPASAAAVSGDPNLTDNATTLSYIPGVVTLGAAAGTSGSVVLNGSTSGAITVQPQAAAGTYNFNLPNAAGTSGQPLLSGGGGATAMTFGTLAVPAGGTGATTLTNHGVVLGQGTSAVVATGAGTAGQVLTSNGAAADPTFQAAGAGTVTSVAETVNGGSSSGIFAITGSPVTTAGTLNINTAGTSGGVPYFSSSTVVSSSAALTANSPVLGGGAGAAPLVSTGITSNGASELDLGVAGGAAGVLGLNGSTSGKATLTAPAVAGTVANAVALSNSLTVGGPQVTVSAAGAGNGVLALSGNTSGTATLTAPAVAGTSTNAVTSSNRFIFPNASAVSPALAGTTDTNTGFYWGGNSDFLISLAGSSYVQMISLQWRMAVGSTIGISSGAPGSGNDVAFSRTAAGEFAVGTGANGSTAGTLNFTTAKIQGKVSTYNAIATVSQGIPAEYATVDLTAQSAAITATTLYAVPAAGLGMYRISWNADITTAGSTSSVLGGTAGFQIVYTSPTDSVVKTTVSGNSVTSAANTTGTAIGGCLVVYAKASTNIQYQFDYTSVGGTAMVYQLHIKCEAM